MRITVVGGGSGGHVTPIRPVLSELKRLDKDAKINMIGKRRDGVSHILADDPNLDSVDYINAGKWRRYHDDSLLTKVFDVRTHLLNLRDLFFLKLGFFQSLRLLRKYKPDVIFIKGGYVGVPVGLAARLLKIPYITHDSDALAGVANRIISGGAKFHAVSAPFEYYPYAVPKMRLTGVPIGRGFDQVDKKQSKEAKKKLGIAPDRPLVLVTGGGLGAQKLNELMIAIASEVCVLADVVNITGDVNLKSVQKAINNKSKQVQDAYQVIGFTDKMKTYLTAADLVIARAGATTIGELAALGKPALIVPAPQLGDQARNKVVLKEAGLAVYEESKLVADPHALLEAIRDVVTNENKRKRLHTAARQIARPDAAKQVAELIVEAADA